MNIELYKIFCCVVSTGNILKASEQLYISQPAVSRSIKQNLTLLPVLQIRDCFIAGEKYKLLSQEKHHLWEITSYPILLLTNTSNSRLFINDYFQNNSIVFEPAFELGNFDLLSHFARNNFGIACVIKNFINDDLEQGKLFEIELFEEIPPRDACIAMLNSTDPSPAAKELIKMMSSNKGI